MKRRFNRIRDHRERAAERHVHEEEEPVAPQPRGRQNRGNHERHNRRHGLEQPQEDNVLILEVHEGGEEEVEQNVGNNPVQGEKPLPPPPTLAN